MCQDPFDLMCIINMNTCIPSALRYLETHFSYIRILKINDQNTMLLLTTQCFIYVGKGRHQYMPTSLFISVSITMTAKVHKKCEIRSEEPGVGRTVGTDHRSPWWWGVWVGRGHSEVNGSETVTSHCTIVPMPSTSAHTTIAAIT